MTNEQILKQAMEKAEKNGWKNPHELSIGEFNLYRKYFSHDFAEAFWGNDRRVRSNSGNFYHCRNCGNWIDKCPNCKKMNSDTLFIEKWQYHLQQMVISEDPIKYLEQYL